MNRSVMTYTCFSNTQFVYELHCTKVLFAQYAYRKSYDSMVEENFRRSVFHENQRKIALHNDQYNLGIFSYKLKTNQFGDMVSIFIGNPIDSRTPALFHS